MNEDEDEMIQPRVSPNTFTIYFTDSYDKANDILQQHEEHNKIKYACWHQSKGFGKGGSDLYHKNHKIMWNDDTISFSGVPFVIVGRKTLDCHFGKDRNARLKKQRLIMKEEKPCKIQRLPRASVKQGCPCQVFIKEIIHFPEHTINNDTRWKRENASKLLRKSIKERSVSVFKRSFLLSIPWPSEHCNHPKDQSEQNTSQTCETSTNATTSTRKRKIKTKNPSPASPPNPIEWGHRCRTILDEINTLTYLIDDNEMIMKDLYTHLEDIKTYLAFAIQQKGHSATKKSNLSTNESDTNMQNVIASKGDTFFTTTENRNTSNTDHILSTSKNQSDKKITNVEINIGEYWTLSARSPDSLEKPRSENHVVKDIGDRHEGETGETCVNGVVVNKEGDSRENDSRENDSLNPQETQALTNMIRVLLEENKNGATSSETSPS